MCRWVNWPKYTITRRGMRFKFHATILVLVHVKDFEISKRSTSATLEAPMKNNALKCLISTASFNLMIYWHHNTSPSTASSASKNQFSTAALLLSAVLVQVCVSWPIRDWVFGRGGPWRDRSYFRQRGKTLLLHWTVHENWGFLSALNQNKMIHLKMSVICLF